MVCFKMDQQQNGNAKKRAMSKWSHHKDMYQQNGNAKKDHNKTDLAKVVTS